jgi:hypothetical protein
METAIQQRRLEKVLGRLIGKICHIYRDDIIIWSALLQEHVANINTILARLRDGGVYANPKKSILFTESVEILGHRVSRMGIEACEKKAGKILDWPVPTSSTETQQFLGLVRYLQQFLPNLAVHCRVLEELTQKQYEKNFPTWTQMH